MRLNKLRKLRPPPPEEVSKYKRREFLFVGEIAYITNLDKDIVKNILQQGEVKPYRFTPQDIHGRNLIVFGYLTHVVKRCLASRGHIIPGFNEEYASQRQWTDVLDDAISRPIDKDWYFPPIHPDPLVYISDENSYPILEKIRSILNEDSLQSGDKLREIADVINVNSHPDDLRKKNTVSL